MAKPIPKLKLKRKASVRKAKGKKKLAMIKRRPNENSWMVIGIDQSVSSIAMAAIGYDGVTRELKGPEFSLLRWSKEDHYFDRLREAVKIYDQVIELQGELGLLVEPDQVWIAQEEPFPPSGTFTSKGISQTLKQQAEISGAFLGGLIRYGFNNLWQISNLQWRQLVAADLGITIHYTKWKNPTVCPMPESWQIRAGQVGKFRAKQWAYNPGYAWQGVFPNEIPDFPDIIDSKKEGKIPKPEDSKAKAIQCDDRYEALAIMDVLYRDLSNQEALG